MSLADSLSEEEEDFLMSSDEDDDDNKLATSKKRKSPSSTKEKNDKSNKKQTKETNKATKSSSATDTLLTTSKNAPKLTLSSAAVTSSSSSSAGGLTNQSIKGVGNTNINIEEDITRGPDVHTEAAAKTLVMKYMIKENRPYSAIQIYDNLHHRIQKSTLEKVLTTLCESYTTSSAGAKQRLLCKEYGKAKIYYPDQNCFEAMSEHELDQLSTQIDMLTKEADKAQKQNRELNARIATLLAEPSDDDIDREIEKQEEQVEAKRQQIAKIKGAGPVDPRAMEKAVKEHNTTRSLWRDRKVCCLDALEMIADGMNKKVKVVMGEMGVDPDEDVGVILPPTIAEVKRQ